VRVGLRWTLRRWSADRFELVAGDALGRTVWSLAVAGSDGVWTDARAGSRCRFAAAAGARFGDVLLPLPSAALPVILLGGLPVALPAGALATTGQRAVEFDDAGRRWRVELADDRVVAWRVSGAGGGEIAWDRRGDSQRLRASAPRWTASWRETAREPLVSPAPEWRFDELPECDDAPLP